MHVKKIWPVGGLVLTLAFGLRSAAADTLTYADLARRLAEVEWLATPPADGERGALASTYDRASQYDAVADRYVNWDANDDGSGVIREKNGRVVLAEINGPGVIWRLWSAQPRDGKLSIYLDGAAEPALELPFKQFFDRETWPWPNLVYLNACDELPRQRVTPGANNFVPIPFNTSCRIVGDKEARDTNNQIIAPSWGWFFQASYTLFPPGTALPKFQWPLPVTDRAALTAADDALSHSGQNPAPLRAGQTTETRSLTVSGSGGSATVDNFNGSGAITGLRIKLDWPTDPAAQRALLRQLTVSITWDDDTAPAVWSPLGDFFATVGGGAPFRTLLAGRLEDGTLYAYWYMPFERRAKIEVGNDGPLPVSLRWEIDRAPLSASAARQFARFHAKWHRNAFLPERADRAIDWTLLVTKGRGRYVGAMLHVWNPRGWWWGEGDEKFFVDGEKFPSTFGTGTEDYFGYAWCSFGYFARPYHSQPLNEGNLGHISNLRWQIADNVPFHTGFEACFEKYFAEPEAVGMPFEPRAAYAAIAYWYLAAGGEDPYGPLPLSDRAGYDQAPPVAYREPGALEGEALKFKARTANSRWPEAKSAWGAYPKQFKPGVWSGDRVLTWGAWHTWQEQRLELLLPVSTSGAYRVSARLTHSEDYGKFQFYVDDEKIGAPVDCYTPSPTTAETTVLGEVTLSAGEHVLRIELAGFNAALNQPKGSWFGLDYIKLEPVK